MTRRIIKRPSLPASRAVVLRGDAAHLPLSDASVDLVLCSPPYFGLRSYTDAGEHYDGQIGSEATVREWLEALWACTAEWMRVLKPGGSIFVNLGDKYSTSMHSYNYRDPGTYTRKTPQPDGEWSQTGWKGTPNIQHAAQDPGLPPKSLMGMPWRYALGCTDQLGLLLRSEIVWDKPNGLPESAKDRVRRSHEQVFHFTRQPRYYSAVDEIREPQVTNGQRHEGRSGWAGAPEGIARGFEKRSLNPLGKLPGSVWKIATSPLKVPAELAIDHFAAYPPELCRRIILGWSPREVCLACGEGRRPVVDAKRTIDGEPAEGLGGWKRGGVQVETAGIGNWRFGTVRTITGYACACSPDVPPSRPGVVLDPFGGTGTTAMAADVLGRTGITVDRSWDYCRLARWRTADPKQRAKVRTG